MPTQPHTYSAASAGYNPNYSAIAMTTNSFQISGGVPDNSFDAIAGANRASGHTGFSNTGTDWHANRAKGKFASDFAINDHI